MSGRGDNNKNGTSGRGASNQSGQGIDRVSTPGKSNHGKQTGGKPSEAQKKSKEQGSGRDTSLKKENK